MEVIKCRSLRRNRTIRFVRRNSYELEQLASSLVQLPAGDDDGGGSRRSLPKWTALWRKLMREKTKMLQRTTSMLSRNHNNQCSSAYDEYTYTQNFDQGASTFCDDEPDVLTRSFSVRFSDPSSVVRMK